MQQATSVEPDHPVAGDVSKYCPACGETNSHRLLFHKWEFPIVACRLCGLTSTEIPADFDPTSLYTRDYFQGRAKDGYADYLSSETVLRCEFAESVAHLRQSGPSEGRLLEIGCAFGFFLLEAQPYYQATGIDVAADAIQFARGRGLDAHQGIADDEFLKGTGPFDAVVMLDVIEHLSEPGKVLQSIADALRPGGSLMITTGDWGSLTARIAGKRWRLMTPPQHLYFFSRATMIALLARVGLEVVDFRHPWKRVPLGLATYQLISRLGIKFSPPAMISRVGVPLNLFDAMRVVARKPAK